MSTNTPNLASVDKFDTSDLLILRMVERVEYGVYRIELLSRNGSALNTIGRVSEVDVVSGEVIYGVNFDYDEYVYRAYRIIYSGARFEIKT